MSADEIRNICSNADMIVCGYAFTLFYLPLYY